MYDLQGFLSLAVYDLTIFLAEMVNLVEEIELSNIGKHCLENIILM